ncbi:uncharacterized protein TNCV_1396781 [Trichonephila clavipes]|nr:uncharacterized protein TNCV_1396781 [Trichonephila clavipes]
MIISQEQRIAIVEFYFAIKSRCRVINHFSKNIQTGSDRVELHSENESDRCGDRFIKKSTEKIVRLDKHHHGIHILAESDERYARLQQDGATYHTSQDSMEVLTEFLDHRVISKGLWPPHLPDL